MLMVLMLAGAPAGYAAQAGIDADPNSISAWSQGIGDTSTDPALYVERGRAYRNSQKHDLAMNDFNRAIELSPEYVPAYVERALVYYENKDYDAACQDYDTIIKLDSGNADAYFRRGACNYYKNELESAVEDLEQAIKLRPEHPGAYLVKGVCYQKLKRKQEAINTYKDLLAHVPPDEKEAIELARKLLKSLGVTI